MGHPDLAATVHFYLTRLPSCSLLNSGFPSPPLGLRVVILGTGAHARRFRRARLGTPRRPAVYSQRTDRDRRRGRPCRTGTVLMIRLLWSLALGLVLALGAGCGPTPTPPEPDEPA